MARMTVGKGEKRIPVRAIAAIQLKPAGMVRGFIQFTVPGGNEGRSRFGSQSVDAAKDENSVLFTFSQQPAFEQLRSAIEQAISGAPLPSFGGTGSLPPPPPPPVAAVPAGWHPDPAGRFEVRYWDGQRWTEHVSTGGTPGVDPLPN